MTKTKSEMKLDLARTLLEKAKEIDEYNTRAYVEADNKRKTSAMSFFIEKFGLNSDTLDIDIRQWGEKKPSVSLRIKIGKRDFHITLNEKGMESYSVSGLSASLYDEEVLPYQEAFDAASYYKVAAEYLEKLSLPLPALWEAVGEKPVVEYKDNPYTIGQLNAEISDLEKLVAFEKIGIKVGLKVNYLTKSRGRTEHWVDAEITKITSKRIYLEGDFGEKTVKFETAPDVIRADTESN
jgi:hypothetical protein